MHFFAFNLEFVDTGTACGACNKYELWYFPPKPHQSEGEKCVFLKQS